ncbi:hypothetical protein EVAR_44981_1 [Eumeta japonica]|uniref:Uncharacterized protein n=1 Tax=Eumeta variegata TaxID=151549 RepID=A0A4C1XIB7_EUMVA|nr:hypothetical protein EVAR_44981_1 [Eumeta japonica]
MKPNHDFSVKEAIEGRRFRQLSLFVNLVIEEFRNLQRSVLKHAGFIVRSPSILQRLISTLLPLDIRLEKPAYFDIWPYPSHVPEIGYEIVEDLEFQTMDRLAVIGPHNYTDSSRLEGKVGATLRE